MEKYKQHAISTILQFKSASQDAQNRYRLQTAIMDTHLQIREEQCRAWHLLMLHAWHERFQVHCLCYSIEWDICGTFRQSVRDMGIT